MYFQVNDCKALGFMCYKRHISFCNNKNNFDPIAEELENFLSSVTEC